MEMLIVAVVLLAAAACLARPNTEGWFAFEPEEDFSASVIDVSEWLDAPAGKHGLVQMREGRFLFEDGTPVKFWGTNLCWSDPAPEKETAERWARFMAKYGVNCIRFHKFTDSGAGMGLGGEDSTSMDPEKMDRMDYFVRCLREQGIYYGWSPIFRHKIVPGESERLRAPQEVFAWQEEKGWGDTGLVNFADDLQEIHLELILGLLEHHNPYTDLRYADDPALVFLEIQNEDDIFWGATREAVEHCPTYKALLCTMFCDWLREEYGSQQALLEAWGEESLQGERLDENDIYPPPGHHAYSPENFADNPERRHRLLDSARFLYETQNDYYGRFAEAMREAGYRAPMIGSCWQAGHGIPHYYNLHADCRVGFVDRHNYYGGGAGRHSMAVGPLKATQMVSRPGSALLTTGMQQVEDRPFAFSEWTCVLPNPWGAETAPLIAAWGLGLQDWDASYQFCSRTNPDLWWETLSARGNVYNVDNPLHLGQYPALARMIYRGDVQPGEPVAVRRIYVPALRGGSPEVEERVEQEGDVKVFGGAVPPEALAVGRCLVEFPEEPAEDEFADLQQSRDEDEMGVRSNTGQLTWSFAGGGYAVIDTPGTQGVVGNAPDETVELGDLTVDLQTPFASLLVTSLQPGKTIAEAERLLVSAFARAVNTDMEYSDDFEELLDIGEPPVLLEPVEAEIAMAGEELEVHALDHAGRLTEQTVPVILEDGRSAFRIGVDYKAVYYLVQKVPS